MPYKIGIHANLGISITRRSAKNFLKYVRTSGASGASGVPKFTNSTPFFMFPPTFKLICHIKTMIIDFHLAVHQGPD